MTVSYRLYPLCGIFLATLLLPLTCQAADVVYVRSSAGPSLGEQQLEVATQFYGVDLKVVNAGGTREDDRTLGAAAERSETVAVVIAAEALPKVNKTLLLRALRRGPAESVPLLILGLTPDTDPTALKAWSGGAAVACERLTTFGHLHYSVAGVSGLTGQLAGIEMPLPRTDTFYLAQADQSDSLAIIKVRDDRQSVPVFIQATENQQKVFLDCTSQPSGSSGAAINNDDVMRAFTEVAPAMIFVKYCAGERGWHALHHYANLTIDDPTLREPYGLLNYKGLFAEMEKHNFHTTIAFIPWNYDRSEPGVVSLFREHPERFSISVHGDNHDHKEFTDYATKPLDVQIAAMRQSLARMDRFQALTGIPYDKVMIFPHSIAPEPTLAALKTHGYLATVNSQNVPMGSIAPSGPAFAMRSVTLLFDGFASVIRHSVEDPGLQYPIAIDAFLGNPSLFYGHHDFFEGGIGAFDHIADQVNRLEPSTRWRGLGEIVKHYYSVKLRDDSDYDVLAFSSNIVLENTTGRNAEFYVRKMEGTHPAVTSVVVDGQAWPFRLDDGFLNFELPIPSGRARGIAVTYENDAPPVAVGIEHSSLRVYALRRLSEFRDNVLSRSSVGRGFIHGYYGGEKRVVFQLLGAGLLVLSCICVAWRLRTLIRRRQSA
jgi:hypothetical protein